MTLFVLLVVLLIISFLWALLSLRHELVKPKALKRIKEELAKEKILFKR